MRRSTTPCTECRGDSSSHSNLIHVQALPSSDAQWAHFVTLRAPTSYRGGAPLNSYNNRNVNSPPRKSGTTDSSSHWDDAQIHVLAHVVSYGSSVFEGIRCYATATGPAIFRLREHMRRLLDSAKIYRMETSDSPSTSSPTPMLELVRVNKLDSCYIRPIVLRGYGDIGVLRLEESRSKSTWPAGNGASISAKKRWPRASTSASPVGPASRPTRCRRSPRRAPTT